MYETKYHTANFFDFTFLVTGGAGFIGSNLVEYLLKYGAKKVRVLDNFSTGYPQNIEEFNSHPAFELINGDIRDLEVCRKSVVGIDYVIHQAALGSVSRSIQNPIITNEINVNGFLNILIASCQAKIKRFVYASSSSVYGDSIELPKVEENIGKPLSPYALTKYTNELYSDVFSKTHGIEVIGLRYFNVFGPKQDPNGPYAAVIPKFIMQLMQNEPPIVYGNGEFSRDFTYIENVIQANILATFVKEKEAINAVYNIAYGESNTINQLIQYLKELLLEYDKEIGNLNPIYSESRQGDIPFSIASIKKANMLLGYRPKFSFKDGLKDTLKWYYNRYLMNK